MNKKAHFIGIAGIGMSGTAMLLKEQGWEVSGSDEGFYPPVSDYLAAHHIDIKTPHKAENIPGDADLIVIGKHAKLTEDNPEVKAAMESGVLIRSYPEVLGDMLKDRHSIVVAGSYGKSSMTALTAHCLTHAGRDPGYMVGAITKNLLTTSHLGTAPEFIVEGDEYPSSNTDPRSKFLHYHARDIILTAATHDHVNVFPTHEDFLTPFRELIASLPQSGLLVACADEPSAAVLAGGAQARVVTYSRENTQADYYAADIAYGETTTFSLMHRGEKIVDLVTTQLGAHTVQNIVGASAYLLERELLTPEELVAGVAAFEGVVRRLDKKTNVSRVPVYEGFGSSHEKARGAIVAMKLHFPNKRLVVVFEPHTFSWRNRKMAHWYDSVFEGVDKVFVYHPPSHGSEDHEQLSHDEIVERVKAVGVDVMPLTEPETGLRRVLADITADDAVLLLTSGNLGGLVKTIPEALDQQFS